MVKREREGKGEERRRRRGQGRGPEGRGHLREEVYQREKSTPYWGKMIIFSSPSDFRIGLFCSLVSNFRN